jgi:hypothetical protein
MKFPIKTSQTIARNVTWATILRLLLLVIVIARKRRYSCPAADVNFPYPGNLLLEWHQSQHLLEISEN